MPECVREYPATTLCLCSEKDVEMTCNIAFLSRLALSGMMMLAVMATTGTTVFAQQTYSEFDIGDCPDELLKQAWIEEHPLQAAAVEREIIVLCTERAEAITAFLKTRIAQDIVLARIWAEEPIPESAPISQQIQQDYVPDSISDFVPDEQVELLRVEIEDLKTRIASLEGQPVDLETEVRLENLHAELALAEGQLKIAENENENENENIEAEGNQSEDTPVIEVLHDDFVNTEQDEILPESSDADDSTKEFSFEQMQETFESAPGKYMTADKARDVIAPLGTMLNHLNQLFPGTANASVSSTITPQIIPERPARWEMLYAIRAGNGPWKVSLQATRQNAVHVPSVDPDTPPVIQWETVVDAPEILALNDSLSDGRVLLEVTDRGVLLGTNSGDDSTSDFISFRPDSSPGILEWKIEKENENS